MPVASGVGKPSSIGDALYAMARVLPGYRRHGVGTAVLAALSRHAQAVESGSLIGRVQEEDEASRRFVEQRGFILVSRECPVALDLTRLGGPPPPEPPAGVVITSIAERPDLVRAAYEVEVETIGDIPVGPEAPTPRAFAAWRTETLDAPGALPDLSLVALEGDDVVGWSGLLALGEDGEAENLLTGVRRSHRGRGIATALKREQARRAKEAGLRRIETTNDEANAPMRAVNARLGFEAEPAWLLVRGPLQLED